MHQISCLLSKSRVLQSFFSYRYHHQSLPHQRCTLFRILQTRSLYVWWAWKSALVKSWTKTKKIAFSQYHSVVANVARTLRLLGSGIKPPKVGFFCLFFFLFLFEMLKIYRLNENCQKWGNSKSWKSTRSDRTDKSCQKLTKLNPIKNFEIV